MSHHMLVKVFVVGLLPMVAIFVAIGVAVVLASKRRCRRAVPVVLPVARPTYQRVNEGGSTRWSIWCVVIVLIAVAAVFQARTVRTMAPAQVETYDPWAAAPPDFAPTITVAENRSVEPPKAATPAHKPKNWMKADRPAPVEPGPPWQGIVERSCVIALADSREETVEAIRARLEYELSLPHVPPASFVLNPAFMRYWEIGREHLKETNPVVGPVVHIRYQAEVTPDGWQELGRLERLDRSDARMEIAARGLGIFTILLGAIAAFIRLDECTKGYYSGRLFLAATGLVAGLGFVVATIR
jgi:hypothetical protein